MSKTLILSAVAAATMAFAAPSFAATITPVGVEASNTFPFFGDYKAVNLINGSGLSGGLHSSYFGDMWMTDLSVSQATLTFDLGGKYDLSGLKVWNYNFGKEEFASTLDRGAKAFVMSISLDGVSYTDVLSGDFARGTGELLAAEDFAVDGVARFVRLTLDKNQELPPYTYGQAPIGLSEVRFEGSAVPEPATWAMMISGFGLAGAALRRRRVAALAA